MKELFPSQTKLVNKTIAGLRDNKYVIMQAPTGYGKSVMMMHIIHRATKKGKICLVLTESKKIFRQLVNEFGAIRINDKTTYLVVRQGACYVAMAQSIANRAKIIEQFLNFGDDVILLTDEAHVGTCNKVILKFTCPRIGVTATPAWKWAKFLPDMYNALIPGPQVETLIDDGILCPVRHIGPRKIDASNLVKASTGDYTEKSQERVFGESIVFAGLYEYLKKVTYKVGIIYVASIKMCEETHANLVEQGYNVAKFHSKLENPESEIERFHNDPTCSLMVSVAALTKGYDNPLIDLVVLYRKTTSLPLYLQMCGRGGRVLRKDEDKANFAIRISGNEISTHTEKRSFTVLDMGLNHDMFFGWDSYRDWGDLWLANPKKSEMPAPVKECPECNSYIHSSSMVCKWCGYEFPVVEKEQEIGELVDFRENYNPLIGKKLSQLTPSELAEWANTKNAKQPAMRVAKYKRYFEKVNSKRWEYDVKLLGEANPYSGQNFIRDFAEAMGYRPAWYMLQTGDIDKAIRQGKPYYFRDLVLR